MMEGVFWIEDRVIIFLGFDESVTFVFFFLVILQEVIISFYKKITFYSFHMFGHLN